MATVTGFVEPGFTPTPVFSGSVGDALQQGFIAAEQLAFVQSLSPELLGMAPQGWEGVTAIEIFESAQ